MKETETNGELSMKSPYYTYAETAEILGIKLSTLYTYIWKRRLKPVQRVGMKNVFEKSYIDKIAKEGLSQDAEIDFSR